MDNSEKIFIGVGLLALVAIIIFNRNAPPNILDAGDPNLPVTDIVGMSSTPDNTNMVEGHAVYMANRRYMFWPPLDNLLPTIAANLNNNAVTSGKDFVRRYVGMFSKG